MSDIIDKANDDAQSWLDGQIAKRTNTNKTIPSPLTECVDCGDDIGMARKQAVPHAIRCMECQTIYEKRGK